MGLKVQGIEKIYPDFRLQLDFQVRPGELLILLGPSGCGKTTSLRTIAGFIDPDSGSIRMDGRRIDLLPAHRRKIGIVFQDYALFPHLNVEDNVAFGLRMQGRPRRACGKRVEELLRLVSLQGYAKRSVTRLSGGEQQRVALARALAPQPRVLLLDEPLSALDAKLRGALRSEIRRIQRKLSITTLYVTHDQEEALVLGDRIAVMRGGRIEQIDTPQAVYNRPANLFVGSFLGKANTLDGRLAASTGKDSGGFMVVETALGRLRTTPQAVAGGEVKVFFRPEHCVISDLKSAPARSPSPEDLNLIHGRVTQSEYLGSRLLIDVQSGGVTVTLDLDSAQKRRVGTTVSFLVDPGKILLFPAAAT